MQQEPTSQGVRRDELVPPYLRPSATDVDQLCSDGTHCVAAYFEQTPIQEELVLTSSVGREIQEQELQIRLPIAVQQDHRSRQLATGLAIEVTILQGDSMMHDQYEHQVEQPQLQLVATTWGHQQY
jgi:hypothetical protein